MRADDYTIVANTTPLIITIPSTLPEVHRCLVTECLHELQEWVVSEEPEALHNAKRALGTLWFYTEAERKGPPSTYDGDGDILNHGRCVL